MNNSTTKAAIIGAGFVGSSIALTLAMNSSVSKLVMIDVNKEKAEGEAMDINHGLPFLGQMDIYAGDYSEVKDSDIIIITAGVNRKPGETRLDLAKKNIAITDDVIQNIMKHYNGGVILVVSNPVDILTYTIQKHSGLPQSHVFGTGTVLDTYRFKYILGQHFHVDVTNVRGYIIGEHGDSQIPLWSTVGVAGMAYKRYCEIYHIDMDEQAIENEVRTAGAQVIQKKGATHYAIAMAVCKIVESVINDRNSILPVSTVMRGTFGIENVALSIPTRVSAQGADRVMPITLHDTELNALLNSGHKLKETLKELGVLV